MAALRYYTINIVRLFIVQFVRNVSSVTSFEG